MAKKPLPKKPLPKKQTPPRPRRVLERKIAALTKELEQAKDDRAALEHAIDDRDNALEVAASNMKVAQDNISNLTVSVHRLTRLVETTLEVGTRLLRGRGA